MKARKVGFIGLGNMGFPMARNLMENGYGVYGSDVNDNAEKQFAEIGGHIGYTPSTISDEVDFVFTSLPTEQIVESVYLGENGLIANSKAPLTLIDVSTVSPELNRKIAESAVEQNVQYLAAPVSGSVSGAENATLTIMVGGDKDIYTIALPYLKAIGKNVFHVGEDHDLGTVVKLINNLILGINTQAVAEGLHMADIKGVDRDLVYDIVKVSSGQSTAFTRNYNDFISKDEYIKGAFTTALLLKDLKLAQHALNEENVKLPIGETLINYLDSSIEGYLDKDMSSTYLMLKEEEAKAAHSSKKGLIT
ncbi:NAD(P)-dependent oxidoreductase [Virgibacillus sp. NKC19-3]|uniref:NAD(P)-dependent oxidoreductase n=1 Tax=Virgibacillus saliphilus TaxID=2831674 RepID=UPI001C9A784A|nr:NAD(P)-dependent oxidoreductase [Virgibacillus sp. NKC19-3]MBY7144283.1 NAD(P)-dependent oxidoreductase [Virgibacillus sp. NKC19-3]